jgi:protein SCO1
LVIMRGSMGMRIIRFIRRQWLTVTLVAVICCICCGGVALQNLRGTAAKNLQSEGEAYNFSLVNATGHSVTLTKSAGKVRLVAFIYTRCNASCPVVTSQMVQLQNNLKREGIFGNDVELISITMDPAYDTESVLRNYEKKYGVAPVGWEFLTGTQQTVDKTLKEYGVYAKKVDATQYVHTVAEFLIDSRGNIRKVYGMDISAQDTNKDIKSLLHTE